MIVHRDAVSGSNRSRPLQHVEDRRGSWDVQGPHGQVLTLRPVAGRDQPVNPVVLLAAHHVVGRRCAAGKRGTGGVRREGCPHGIIQDCGEIVDRGGCFVWSVRSGHKQAEIGGAVRYGVERCQGPATDVADDVGVHEHRGAGFFTGVGSA